MLSVQKLVKWKSRILFIQTANIYCEFVYQAVPLWLSPDLSVLLILKYESKEILMK